MKCSCDLCKTIGKGGDFYPEEVNAYLDHNDIKTKRYETDKYVKQKIKVGSFRGES